MSEPCEREKKALDTATARRDTAEGRLNDLEFEIQEWEAEAQRALGSTSECIQPLWHTGSGGLRWHTEGEYTIDEQCVIDKWVYASKLLEAARERRSGSVYNDYWARLEAMRGDEEVRKAAYCDCLNRERPR